MEFFDIPLTRFAGTIADVSGVRAPEYCPKERVEEIKTLVRDTTGKETVDKVVIYNPDALGAWYVDKYAETFKPVTSVCPLRVNYLTSYPPKTPVCFGTMFTGATPDQHGIHHYDKHLLKIESLFDVWAEAGKKVAMVSVAGQSIPILFAERDIDYYLYATDGAVTAKAVELIESGKYDVVEVYTMEYDTVMHMRDIRCREEVLRGAEHASYVLARSRRAQGMVSARQPRQKYTEGYESVSFLYRREGIDLRPSRGGDLVLRGIHTHNI